MREPALGEEDLEVIGAYVKSRMVDWMKDAKILPLTKAEYPNLSDQTMGETLVRVEEAIKHQGDLLVKMLHQMDKRFEQVDKRFEQVDKRFEELRTDMNNRFEELRTDMNNRFTYMTIFISMGFLAIGTLIAVFKFIG